MSWIGDIAGDLISGLTSSFGDSSTASTKTGSGTSAADIIRSLSSSGLMTNPAAERQKTDTAPAPHADTNDIMNYWVRTLQDYKNA